MVDYFCFYHVYASNGHVHYHHVIISITESDYDMIKFLETDSYSYRLITALPIKLANEDEQGLIIRGLVMDGESLLKRLRSQQKKNHSTHILK